MIIYNCNVSLMIFGAGFLYEYYFVMINFLGFLAVINIFTVPYLLKSKHCQESSTVYNFLSVFVTCLSLGSLVLGIYN